MSPSRLRAALPGETTAELGGVSCMGNSEESEIDGPSKACSAKLQFGIQ